MSNTRHARPREATARRFAADCSGATVIEYGIMTLIAIAIMALVSQIGGTVQDFVTRIRRQSCALERAARGTHALPHLLA